MATAGLLAFASCQEKAGYTIKGTIEGVAEGDTVYLQNFVDGSLVKMDSAVVKGGAFEFKGKSSIQLNEKISACCTKSH